MVPPEKLLKVPELVMVLEKISNTLELMTEPELLKVPEFSKFSLLTTIPEFLKVAPERLIRFSLLVIVPELIRS